MYPPIFGGVYPGTLISYFSVPFADLSWFFAWGARSGCIMYAGGVAVASNGLDTNWFKRRKYLVHFSRSRSRVNDSRQKHSHI